MASNCPDITPRRSDHRYATLACGCMGKHAPPLGGYFRCEFHIPTSWGYALAMAGEIRSAVKGECHTAAEWQALYQDHVPNCRRVPTDGTMDYCCGRGIVIIEAHTDERERE